MALSDKALGGIITAGGGILNTGLQYLFNQFDKEAEQQWWYEQQKYIEEHNSPAYRAMQMKQAGLNPFTEVGSVPLGNVDSSLPRLNVPHTFDVNAIQNSLLLDAQRENIEQDTETKKSVQGLNEEKTKTESEWRANIIQQTLNLQQEYELGLISKEERNLRLQEYKEALNLGYNSYLIEWDLNDSNRLLNDSLISLNEKEGKIKDQEALIKSVGYASATLQLTLDMLYSQMERKAKLYNLEVNNAFTYEEYKEFLDTQEVRQSLLNVQKAFAYLAKNEAERQDELAKITNEKDKLIAEQMLEDLKNGESLDYWMLNMLQNDPGAILNSLTNIATSFAPNVNFTRSSTKVVR